MGRAQAAWTRWTRAAAAPPAAAALDRTSGASSGNADGAGAGAADAPEHVRVVANFLPAGQAAALRAAFDAKFEDPYATSPERFVWDFWHVPGQYSQMRTPALDFFCEADYSTLEAALLEHGKAELGCVGVTQIWLSYYVDGCGQELHCDNVHGPWAFVLSLTDWDARRFSGGETMLLSPLALDFWGRFEPGAVIQRRELMVDVPARWNQLLVFDPRVPHGVREVRAARDPRAARLVLHGWYAEPEMFVEGALSATEAEEAVNACMGALAPRAENELPEATGTVVLRIHVAPSGHVERVRFLTDTLVLRPWAAGPDNNASDARATLRSAVLDIFASHVYPKKDTASEVTFPVIFE